MRYLSRRAGSEARLLVDTHITAQRKNMCRIRDFHILWARLEGTTETLFVAPSKKRPMRVAAISSDQLHEVTRHSPYSPRIARLGHEDLRNLKKRLTAQKRRVASPSVRDFLPTSCTAEVTF